MQSPKCGALAGAKLVLYVVALLVLVAGIANAQQWCDSTFVAFLRVQTDSVRHQWTTTPAANYQLRAAARIDSAAQRRCLTPIPPPPDTTPPPLNRPPVASFTWVCSGQSCTMTSTSVDPDGDPLTCAWHSDNLSHADLAGCTITRRANSGWAERLNVTDSKGASAGVSHPVGTVPMPPDSLPCVGRCTTLVRAGANLQAALDLATCGDTLVLEAATWTGNYVLPPKGCTANSAITVRSIGRSPAAGTRVTPGDSIGRATIVTPSVLPALATALSATGWRVEFVEITTAPGFPPATVIYNIVALGEGANSQNSLSLVARDLVLSHVYIHAQPSQNVQRCVGLNSGKTAIVDSWLSDCHAKGFDSQAIGGWNGPGPYLIENNRLEGAGENIIFGGAIPAIPGLVPSDITIRGNYVTKPRSWQASKAWTIKNLLEFKNARRVVIEGNVFRNSWPDGQVGFALLFNAASSPPASGGPGCSWCTVDSVVVRENWIDSVTSGFNISEYTAANAAASGTRRITVTGNLLTNVTTLAWQINRRVDSLVIDGNTAILTPGTGNTGVGFGENPPIPKVGFVWSRNLLSGARYPFFSSVDYSWGIFAKYAPGGVVTGNMVVGTVSGTLLGNRVVQVLALSPDFSTLPALGAGADVAGLRGRWAKAEKP